MTAETYIVRQGDTLGKIAAQNGVSIDELAQTNHIRNRNKIVAGQRLNIPKKKEEKPQTLLHVFLQKWCRFVLHFLLPLT